MSNLPPPPSFKPTIIQIKGNSNTTNDNFEVSTSNPAYSNDTEGVNSLTSNTTTTRKRRRSSTNTSEIEKRKKEHKAAHSIIEKKRRIKMNREFEALKYLIPACRNSNSGTGSSSSSSSSNASSNGKIDGMYKLTILQASVEYLKYLHFIVNQQNAELRKANPNWNFDDSFTKFDINLNDYRDIEREFSFHDLPKIAPPSGSYSGTSNDESSASSRSNSNIYLEDIDEGIEVGFGNDYQFGSKNYNQFKSNYQLPTLPNSNASSTQIPNPNPNASPNPNPQSSASLAQFQSNPNPTISISNPNQTIPIQLPTPEITPEISPIMSQLLKSIQNGNSNLNELGANYNTLIKNFKFNLPDPMLNENLKNLHELEANLQNAATNSTEDFDHEASRALLLLRKTSIDSLLN